MEIKFTHIYMDKWDKKEHKSNLKLDLRTYNAVFKHVSLRLGSPNVTSTNICYVGMLKFQAVSLCMSRILIFSTQLGHD